MSRAALGQVGGVEMLVEEDHAFPLVRFVVALRMGATCDPVGRAGRLHLALEMLLRGTSRRGRRAFHARLERLGASVDSQVGHDSATLRGVCLARFLPEVFALVTEALLCPAFEEVEWQQLRAESIDLARLERDDDDALADMFLRRTLFAGHPLARPSCGDADSLLRQDLAEVASAVVGLGRGHLLLAFAGDVTPAVARQVALPLAESLVDGPEPAAPPPLRRGAAPLRLVVVDKPQRSQVQLRVGQLALDAYHPEVDALWLGVAAFGGTFTSPFTQQIRDERGWSYVAQADMRRRSRHLAPLTLRCAPAIETLVPCLRLTLDLLAALAAGELPAMESLRAARQYMLGRMPFEVASAHARLGLAVSLRLLGLSVEEVDRLPALWENIDLASIAGVLRRHLQPRCAVATVVAPAAAVVDDLAKAFPEAAVEVVDYRAPVAADA